MKHQQNFKWLAPAPYIVQIPVQAAHIDDFNHVNNVVYVQWMARVAWHHSKALGFDFAAYQARDCGFVVRRHEIEYKQATHAGDIVHCATWISLNDGRLHLRRRFQMISSMTGQTLALGVSDFVPMRLSTNRACRMPAAYKTGYPAMAGVEEIFAAR